MNLIVYIIIAILVLGAVIYIIMAKMRVVNTDLEERSDEYKNHCEVAGSGRLCKVSQSNCENTGGSFLGHDWDCAVTMPVCCQY